MVVIALQHLVIVAKKAGHWFFFISLFTAQSGSAMADGIYKFVAEDGTVSYSDNKPRNGPYKRLEPTCLVSYIGCFMSRSDWRRVPLNRAAYRDQITEIARKHGVDPALVRAMVHAESNFNKTAISRAGAQGLMQLMPATQQKFGVSNPYDVTQNLNGGTALVKVLLGKYKYDIKLVAAAYNAGETAVTRYKGIPPYEETRNYVKRVTLLYARYRTST
jgi:soluble lytic murein transglycosylase-like protein